MNDEQLYSIGDAARRTGLSVSAIRFYADDGVVAPTSQNAAGHRFYDVDAIARLELVRTLRDLGAGLDGVRELLAEETSLAELASAHLQIVERHMRELRARRAVLRTVVNQPTTTDRVALMHGLVSMSDDGRDRVLDEFWGEVTEGLSVHPAFTEHLSAIRPQLPEDPTTEQLQAWIELAELVRDSAFRESVRRFLHTSFASPKALELTSPTRLARIERHRRLEVEAAEAERSGAAADTSRARELAEALLASFAELSADATGSPLGDDELAELRRSLSTPRTTTEADRRADEAVAEFTGVLGTYLSLLATINGEAGPEMGAGGASEEWLAAALSASDA
ncbi:MerR family transcriptional regulator [Saccharopolyspora sp. MS10]|uniref:helix-turn-helix domain-containing protein n=1 Tax=Saccharopolyspora sp. MS10 TaxID=3385973 RepID=UPI00399F3276